MVERMDIGEGKREDKTHKKRPGRRAIRMEHPSDGRKREKLRILLVPKRLEAREYVAGLSQAFVIVISFTLVIFLYFFSFYTSNVNLSFYSYKKID